MDSVDLTGVKLALKTGVSIQVEGDKAYSNIKMSKKSSRSEICLLKTISRLFKVLIGEQLIKKLQTKGNLHDNQYGYRKGRSKIPAIARVYKEMRNTNKKWCVLILLDVEHIFNTATHSLILKELLRRNAAKYPINILSEYFKSRKVKYGKGITLVYMLRSVLGPTLWNVLYNGTIGLFCNNNCTCRRLGNNCTSG